MLRFIRKMLDLADEFSGKLKLAFVLSFIESLLSNAPIFATLFVFTRLLDGTLTTADAWLGAAALLAAIVFRCLLRRWFIALQSGTGYDICARERIGIGDRFKRFPMSYFTEGNIGNVSSAVSIDLLFIEEHGMGAMDRVVNGYVGLAIGCAMLLLIDWRIGLVSVALSAIAMLSLEKLQKVGKRHSRIRQEQQAALTSAVLEYVQGISVIKAFHMIGDKAQSLQETIRQTRDRAIDFENKFAPPSFRYQTWFSLLTALTIFMAACFSFYGTMNTAVMLMLFIYVFYMFLPIKSLAGLTSQIRVMEAGLERYERLKQTTIMDEDGRDVRLERFDVAFHNVSFAYEARDTLREISFTVPEKSMTALVGMSGSGKTTIANLIVRFWDVQQGEVKIGGVNVKELTCESLLRHISMVFQKVYLFHDTIFNNIRFGKPDATFEEVVEAAKKARCHEFIINLEDGYDTVVGEGGGSLSGGEKQRISIARAILKDAPIILLDEATASVDPDNERHIQAAINELVHNKTLIVIAHRLSTIRSADQILVMDDGKLVQKGTHEQLIRETGPYSHLWEKRQTARSWKIAARPESITETART